MKFKTTYKEMKNGYLKVFKCPYCAIQDIEYLTKPIAYNCGVYGHNYDVYEFGQFAITTGYRPQGEELNKKVIEQINKIAQDYNHTYKLGHIGYDDAHLDLIYDIEMLLNHVYKGEMK